VILSFEIGARKPDAEIYEAALRSVATRAEDALFVDDQADYCDGARALGIDTRLMLRPGAQPDQLAASTDGHVVIHDLATLLSRRDEDDGLRIREPSPSIAVHDAEGAGMDDEMMEAAEAAGAEAVDEAVAAEALHEDAVEKAAEAAMLMETAEELATEAVIEEAVAEDLAEDAMVDAAAADALADEAGAE
jgi:hypothetical protein